MKKVILIILIYLSFLLETLIPNIFPKISLLLFTFSAFSSSILFSTLLGLLLGFLFDLNNPPIFGFNMLIFSSVGFLIPYLRNYILPTPYNLFFSSLFVFILFSLINKNFFFISFLLTLLSFFLLRNYEKKI